MFDAIDAIATRLDQTLSPTLSFTLSKNEKREK